MKKLLRPFICFLLLGLTRQLQAQAINIVQVQQACSNNGILEATAVGLTAPITFDWYDTGGNVVLHASSNLVDTLLNYSGDNVYCMATDNNGVQAWGWYYSPPFQPNINLVWPVCPATTGSATVTVTGGLAPYQFDWHDLNTGAFIVSGSPASLPQGDFYVDITDANGCTLKYDDSISIHQYSNLVATTSVSTASCTNGSATVTSVTGGPAPYTYLWSNGLTTPQINGLVQGTYGVVVTDSQGCQANTTVYVPQSVTIGANVTPTAATCLQNNGGAITFGSGGTPPYSYAYSNGQTTQTANGLLAGSYQVTVTDANNCISSLTYFNINASTPINVTYTASPSSCTSPTGSATLTITGGQAPYAINWNCSPPQTGPVLANVPQGIYNFNATDANGCVRAGLVSVGNISNMNAGITIVPAACPANNGAVSLSAYSNNPPISYVWSTGATTAVISSLAPGSYSCVLTDAVGCQLTKYAAVPSNSPIVLSFSTTPASCIFTSDGSVTVLPSGGTPPYTYYWAPGSTTNTYSGLAGGQHYWVHVTDANGCTQSAYTYLSYNSTNTGCYCTVTGTVYHDLNANCVQDLGEPPVQNILVKNNNTNPNYNISNYMFTTPAGTYSFILPSGSYNIQEVVQSMYPLSGCQGNSNPLTIVASPGCTYTVDFANAVNPIHDVHILTTNVNSPIPGNSYYQQLIVQNDGTIAESSVEVGYVHDGQLQFATASGMTLSQPNSSLAPNWYSTSGVSLNPGQGTSAMITYNVPTNIPINTQVNFMDTTAYTPPMSNWLNDYTPWNNVDAHTAVVIGSFDPNMKEVSPAGIGAQGYITSADTVLDYIIHFQNTGTWYASKIVVVDTLDADLSWETLKPGYSDHSYVTTMDKNGVVSFTFNNINLPPQSYTELGSRGMVTYSIHTKKNLAQGTQFTNSAAIYFDYNAPVITNTTLNTLNDNIGITEVKSGDGHMSLFPNPASGHCMVKLNVAEGTNATLTVYSMSGQILATKECQLQEGPNTLPLNLADLADGLYVVRVHYAGTAHFCKLSLVR
jgi:hypothetical protein